MPRPPSPPDSRGLVLLLNGAGSAGKSAIAKALQRVALRPLLHLQMDAFLEMLPDALQDHPDAFSYRVERDGEGRPVVAIAGGPVGRRCLAGMRRAVAAMAAAGNDLIVDDVLSPGDWADYRSLLAGFPFYSVGVFCPLAVLEARERARGDRLIGLARGQVETVHRGVAYDLTLDSSVLTPMECAEVIAERFGL